jgi:hypothetical protein
MRSMTLISAFVLFLAASPTWADTGVDENNQSTFQRALLKKAPKCPSRKVKDMNFNPPGTLTEFLQHSDAGSAANCCRVCAKQQGKAADGLGNCIGWISTTKPIFRGGPVCLTLMKSYPAAFIGLFSKDSCAKKGTHENPVSYPYHVGRYRKGCACPPKV